MVKLKQKPLKRAAKYSLAFRDANGVERKGAHYPTYSRLSEAKRDAKTMNDLRSLPDRGVYVVIEL